MNFKNMRILYMSGSLKIPLLIYDKEIKRKETANCNVIERTYVRSVHESLYNKTHMYSITIFTDLTKLQL